MNKQKKVSNGNYLWASYFWSYLGPTGRAGFVMSSQASGAGHGEKEVQKYLAATAAECGAVPAALAPFEATLAAARAAVGVVADAEAELGDAHAPYEADRAALLKDLAEFGTGVGAAAP